MRRRTTKINDQVVTEAATYTTQQTQDANIHALSGIRTRDPKNQATPHIRSDRAATRIGIFDNIPAKII